MSIILQFYPNGEFTQGVDTSSKRRSRLDALSGELLDAQGRANKNDVCAEMNAEISKDMVADGTQFMSAMGSLHTYLHRHHDEYHYAVEPAHGEPYVIESEHPPTRYAHMVGATPLGSSDGLNFTETPKPKRKAPSTMTKRMGRNIRSAAYLLERQHGKDNLSFLTLTLPDLPSEGLQVCAENWGKMVDQYLKWLRSVIEEKHGGELQYTYCTEVQVKRLETRGEYALHLHLLFVGRRTRRSPWYITPKKARKAWVRCIKSVYSGDFKQTALENLQRIKKSAARYLSKYFSKGSKDSSSSSNDTDVPWFTGHWGGISRSLRQSIDRLSIRFSEGVGTGHLAHTFINGIPRLISSGLVSYFCSGFIQTSHGEHDATARGIHVGVGSLSRPLLDRGLTIALDFLCRISKSDISE